MIKSILDKFGGDKMTEHYKFHQNLECEFFPCHKTTQPEKFNCLFCYCPLYTLGDGCGGNPVYIEGDIKDCSKCMLPHSPKAYDHVISKYGELMELAKKNKKKI
jgi:Zn-finger protein